MLTLMAQPAYCDILSKVMSSSLVFLMKVDLRLPAGVSLSLALLKKLPLVLALSCRHYKNAKISMCKIRHTTGGGFSPPSSFRFPQPLLQHPLRIIDCSIDAIICRINPFTSRIAPFIRPSSSSRTASHQSDSACRIPRTNVLLSYKPHHIFIR